MDHQPDAVVLVDLGLQEVVAAAERPELVGRLLLHQGLELRRPQRPVKRAEHLALLVHGEPGRHGSIDLANPLTARTPSAFARGRSAGRC